MANKLVPRTYKCNCGATLKEYVWDSDVHKQKFKCPACSGELGLNNIKIEKTGSVTAIRTPTKNR
jgi:DNA-directed RNA polymerase subunit RPC12/RpoP